MLTLRTFSKLYGLAGLRVGYGVGPQGIHCHHAAGAPALQRQRAGPVGGAGGIGRWRSCAAQLGAEPGRAGVFSSAEFKKLGLEFVPSHGNFILVRVGKGQEVYKQLLSQGVIVRPMGGYQFPEHIRVTVGTMDENRKFIEALNKVIKNF